MSFATIKAKALSILKKKMCDCKRKLKRKFNTSGAIAICTKSILQSKGFTTKRFTCKKRKPIEIQFFG